MSKANEPPLAGLEVELTGGKTTTLGALPGTWLVLYFYPRDSTPGCTTEGQDFNARLADFQSLGVTVCGVSRDSMRSHENFRTKQAFDFDLASDVDEKLCKAFDVIREKNMYGRTVLGIERSTFVLNQDREIVAEWRRVRVPGHAEAVLASVRELSAAAAGPH